VQAFQLLSANAFSWHRGAGYAVLMYSRSDFRAVCRHGSQATMLPVVCLQVCHSSKQWNGLLYKAFGMQLNHYFDTQQANYVWKVCVLAWNDIRTACMSRRCTTQCRLLCISSAFDKPAACHPLDAVEFCY
jgi:hypothetical protein